MFFFFTQLLHVACVYLQVPNRSCMVKGRVHLPDPVQLSDIPHIQAVVIVHTAEPAAHGIVGDCNDVWVSVFCFGVK